MIMISSTAAQKVGKPPPPVPPRPSKSVVAEALAKSRQHHKVISIQEAAKAKPPTRQAPPPPEPRNEIAKSKSSYSVNVSLKKPVVYERSISEEVKNTSRPVVYQSSNIKCKNNNNNVHITRRDSDVKIVNNSGGCFHKTDHVLVARKEEKIVEDEGRHRVQVSRKESVKRDRFCGEINVGKHVGCEGSDDKGIFEGNLTQNAANDTKSRSNASTLEKTSDSSERNGSSSSLDKKNWDKMLNDRNHVNTLIDEMFASVLEVQFNDDDSASTNKHKQSNGVSQDKTKIIINNTDYENLKFDKGEVISSEEQCKLDSLVYECDVPKTIIVIKDSSDMDDQRENIKRSVSGGSNTSSAERQKQVKFKDQLNHELLIKELQCMKQDQDKILKRQRKPSMNIYDNSAVVNSESTAKDSGSDWMDANSGGYDTKLNTCQIEINDNFADTEVKKTFTLDYERITKMSSLHGLPPLPKSLSGFSLLESHHQGGGMNVNPPTPMRSSSMRSSGGQQVPPGHLVYPPHPKVNGDMALATSGRKSTNMDTQLAILRREMYGLRQLDLSLLSQLWSLNESIQDFRQILQDQEDRVLSPPSPSPTPSSGEDMDGDEFYMSASSLNFRPAPPPPPGVRRPSSSSNASSLG